jgi:hypothetical protein
MGRRSLGRERPRGSAGIFIDDRADEHPQTKPPQPSPAWLYRVNLVNYL